MSYSELKEKTSHGSPEFPVQYYFVDSSHSRYVMPLHWHKEFEIDRVISGSFDAFVNNTCYRLSAGDVLMIDCGSLHRGEPHDCIYECLVFDAGMLRKSSIESLSRYILPVINHTVSVRPFFSEEDSAVFGIADELFRTVTLREEFYELRLYSLLFSLFETLYRGGDIISLVETQQDERQLQCMMILLNWIEAHFAEPVALADLAAVSGMSEKYLCRFFRRYTAQTPIDYINRRRIEAACGALVHDGMSVTEAAFASGFNDVSYFSKLFRRYKGMPPREYRRMTASAKDAKAFSDNTQQSSDRYMRTRV